ncbi:hypothetical protein FKM82_025193 [Ascaphus truei]
MAHMRIRCSIRSSAFFPITELPLPTRCISMASLSHLSRLSSISSMRGSGTYGYSNPWEDLYRAIMVLSALLILVRSALPPLPGSTHDRGSSGSTGSDKILGPIGSISLFSICSHRSCSSLSLCSGVNSPTAHQ